MTHITSRKNNEIQRLRRLLEDSGLRRREQIFVCQGEVMLGEALRSGMTVERVYCLESKLAQIPDGVPVTTVTPDIIEVISGVESASGVVSSYLLKLNVARIRANTPQIRRIL